MNILIAVIMVSIVFGLLISMTLVQAQQVEKDDYESRGNLFTPVERSFLVVLEKALDSRYRVFGKVRLEDLIGPAAGIGAGKRTAALNRINQKYVDFVVCTANELALVGVLQLDYQSYKSKDRAVRDEFIDQALANARIPLLRFPARLGYSAQDVRARLTEEMIRAGSWTKDVSVAQKPIDQTSSALDAIMGSTPVQSDSVVPGCPKCSAAMVKRLVHNGQNSGRHFWACSTFPMCRQVLDIAEV
jgi:hypothetical protein